MNLGTLLVWEDAMMVAQDTLLTADQEFADAVMFGKGPTEAELASCPWPPEFSPSDRTCARWQALRVELARRLMVSGWTNTALVSVCHFDHRTITKLRRALCRGATAT